jgi:hypothetical protein
MDFNSGLSISSEQELDTQSKSVTEFLTKHINKLITDRNSKPGEFLPNSSFKKRLLDYTTNTLTFIDFSLFVSEIMYSAIAGSDMSDAADLLFCNVKIEGSQTIVILKCNNKIGFTHQVIKDVDTLRNDIIHHYAILPNPSQRIDEYALINLESLSILFNDKKRFINGKDTYIIPDILLECNSSISQKNTLELVNQITRKVSESHGQSSVAAITKAKNFIVENAEISDYLDPIELGKDVFSSSVLMQEEYIKEVKDAGISETVKLDRAFALRKGKSHKIKTDTGIELTFPADYFQNKDYLEFINNPDGTISIQLKNIGTITSK